jgi:hypothetical protein
MASSEMFTREYRLKAIFVFGVAIVILLNRFMGHSLLCAMKHPLFLFEQKEWAYQFFLFSHIPQVLTSSFAISLSFDVMLFILPVLFVVTLNRTYALAFIILLGIYFFTYNLVTGHHYHGLIGVVLIAVPFMTKKETRFNLLWEAVRYYWLYVFVSAALWKITRGSVFYTEQLSDILKAQQLDLLLQQPDSFRAHIVSYLIANPPVSHWVLVVNVLVQLSFIVGFVTKKYDVVLFVLAIVFCIANYFVMSIVSTELLILNLTLLNWEKIAALNFRNLSA